MCGKMAEELNFTNKLFHQLEQSHFDMTKAIQEDMGMLMAILGLPEFARDESPHKVMMTEIIPTLINKIRYIKELESENTELKRALSKESVSKRGYLGDINGLGCDPDVT